MGKRILVGLVGLLIISCQEGEKVKKETLNNELQTLKKEVKMGNTIAEKNKNTVRAFFRALENGNADEVANLFAEDAKHINPYASGIFPEGAEGKEGIRNYWKPVFPNFDGMEFPIEEIYAMEEPSIVYVKYTGRIKLKDDAGYYENSYYSTFRFSKTGEITEYVEIFNPITAARGFGLLDKIK